MTLLTTPLDALHRQLGARMVAFAGYDMPVQYPTGIIKEHLQTRASAGLFDVSHMGQIVIEGAAATAELEALVPADLESLAVNHSVYSLLMNDGGGVRDDLIITRWGADRFFVVINAGCKHDDIAYLTQSLSTSALTELDGRALLALQGPLARTVIGRLSADAAALVFMTGCQVDALDTSIYITCSGYTGEDGFELSIPNDKAATFAEWLLAQPEVAPIGLGARDSLRLEAGLCLYGHELTPEISPIEAGIRWAIASVRRPDGARAGGYPGADQLAQQIADGTTRARVGLVVEGKRPVRDGQQVNDSEGNAIGSICSGAFGPSVAGPIAMAYVKPAFKAVGTEVVVDVRGTRVIARVAKLPLVPQRYHRG